jgi:hypothetical protein
MIPGPKLPKWMSAQKYTNPEMKKQKRIRTKKIPLCEINSELNECGSAKAREVITAAISVFLE